MIVFSEEGLRHTIDYIGDFDWSTDDPVSLGDEIAVRSDGGHRLFVRRGDTTDSRLIVVSDQIHTEASLTAAIILRRILERLHRAAREFWDPPVSLPNAWHKYQTDNRLAFFAIPQRLNDDAWRWISERLDNDDVAFWKLTSRKDEESLDAYDAEYERAADARGTWVSNLHEALSTLPEPGTGPQALQPSVDLDVVGSRAVTRQRNYSAWLDDLTDQQIEVLNFKQPRALKVRGPAGTGKTLTLQMKALNELYAARERASEDFRVLYLTHSWALAEQVESSLAMMDEQQVLDSLDTLPVAWLRELLYGKLPEGIEILGDDSVDGKLRQLSLISEMIDAVLEGDWATFKGVVSPRIVAGVESGHGSQERTALCWDLMREFNEVIDAQGLKPGLDSLRRYLALPRQPWMVPLPESADLEFVFTIYRGFVQLLVEEGQLTTDQALDDLRRYLESYEWNLRRATDGYDLVIVDEFHLFNDTERYLAHLLTRDAEVAPRMILALDPYQSAYTLLTGLDEGELSRTASRNIPGMDPADALDLKTVHRFTKKIYQFVRLVHSSFPNLVELGADWTFDFASTDSREIEGETPRILFADSSAAGAIAALSLGQRLNAETPANERVAVIATGLAELDALRRAAEAQEANKANAILVIEGRDEIDRLNYSRKSVIVSAAEFLAGLQFAHVIVLLFQTDGLATSGGTSALRASLSNLYLAATRSESSLSLVTVGDDGPLHDLVLKALDQELAVKAEV